MTPLVRRLVGLALPPAVFNSLDCMATLSGQSAAYWAGDARAVNEASPTFHQLLALHPAAFVVGGVALALLVAAVVLLLPDALAIAVSVAVTAGHANGVASWVRRATPHDYQAGNALVLAAALLIGACVRYGWRPDFRAPHPLGRWPAWVRVLLAAALVALGAWLFLIPR